MAHLEGVLTLVTGSGPWFRLQGAHIRASADPVTLRMTTSPDSGITVDVHLGCLMWLRVGWYPRHAMCHHKADEYPVSERVHRCWARFLPARTFDLANALRPATS